MKHWWAVAFGLLGGLLGAGLLLLVANPPNGEAIHLSPPPTAPPLLVHVDGAVSRPGVYALAGGSRIQDAIESAGGLLAESDPGSLNLAAFLEDGERVSVPFQVEGRASDGLPARASPAEEPLIEEPPEGAGGGGLATSTPDWPVDINTASQAELESLPGIGPVLAGRIIAYRQENGPFSKIEDIQNVSGIGSKTFERFKDLITVGGP